MAFADTVVTMFIPFSVISIANALIVFKLTGFPCLATLFRSKHKRDSSEFNEVKIRFIKDEKSNNKKNELTQSVFIEYSTVQHPKREHSESRESNSSNFFKTNNTSKLSNEKSLSANQHPNLSSFKPFHMRSFKVLANNRNLKNSSPRSVSLKINNECSFAHLNKNKSSSYVSLMTTNNFTKRIKIYSRTTIILLTISTAYLIL